MLSPGADVHLFDVTDRPRRARKPLVASTLALRAIATAITLSSFGGMTIFASENLYTSKAPLQPAAVATVATTTPAPTTAPTTVTTSRTTVRSSVASTSTAANTRTKQS
jgi:hypothetical protein